MVAVDELEKLKLILRKLEEEGQSPIYLQFLDAVLEDLEEELEPLVEQSVHDEALAYDNQEE